MDKELAIIAERRIRYDRATGEWLVLGDNADPLAPKPYRVRLSAHGDTCDCPALKTCKHIKAARLIQAALRR